MMTRRNAKGSDGRADPGHWDIVLAEDNDDHAVLIEMALQRATQIPVELRRANDGSEALELVRERTPDLLLLDLKMPGLSGHEVLQAIKGSEEMRRVPVAVLTSSDRDEDIAESYGLGGNHFITKPENPAELEERLRSLLKNLSELSTIRRGSEGLAPTGASAVDPGTVTLRKVMGWLILLIVIAALAAYALASGVLG